MKFLLSTTDLIRVEREKICCGSLKKVESDDFGGIQYSPGILGQHKIDRKPIFNKGSVSIERRSLSMRLFYCRCDGTVSTKIFKNFFSASDQ